MLRGLYTAASGMISAERRQEILSNNLSNAHTPGYKQEQSVLRAFPDMLIERIRDGGGSSMNGIPSPPGRTPLGTLHTGVYTQEAIPLFAQGDIQETGRMTDVAIVDQSLPLNPESGNQGHLFFAVQVGEDEIAYTRNGRFAVDEEGFLTTGEGYYVLNNAEEAPLEERRILIEHEGMHITEDGRIVAQPDDPDSFEDAQHIWLGYTEEPERLVRAGHGVWRWMGDEEQAPQLVDTIEFIQDPEGETALPYQIQHRFVERSNVDMGQTMAEMMNMLRQYEANQRVLQAYDRSMEQAANEVGRVF